MKKILGGATAFVVVMDTCAIHVGWSCAKGAPKILKFLKKYIIILMFSNISL